MSIVILLILFALMWLVLIVPRQRELRRHNALMDQLAEGDEVMTSSGIYGTLVRIDGDYVQLEVSPGLQVKMAKRAVAAKVDPTTLSPAQSEPDVPTDRSDEN